MTLLRLDTPLFEALGAKNVFLKRLEKLGIKTVGDLIRHFPTRYEDFSHIVAIAELAPGEEATIQGVVRDVETKYTRRGMAIIEAIVEDESGSIRAVWFNQPYIANTLRTGRTVNLAGKVSISDSNEIYLSHPAHELVRETNAGFQASVHTARLIPVYPETKGLTSRGIRFLMVNLLKHRMALDEWLPEEILAANEMPNIGDAFSNIHFPAAIEDALLARRRFLFEDLFLLQIANLERKLALARESAPEIPTDIEKLKTILAKLPFELTPSQKRSLWEIIQDIAKPRPMNRLLQGDVGSGKTIIAALSALAAAHNGFETAFMAPTEILARQHFETFQKIFKTLPDEDRPAIALITSSAAVVSYGHDVSGKTKKADVWKSIARGEIAIVFGTHALIQRTATFKNLGLVVIDEQHRFGVKQRAALLKSNELRVASSGKNAEKKSSPLSASPIPHFLSMSATPIPRTIMMTVFGDLDISLITELPPGRQPIDTTVVQPNERTKTYHFVRREIQAGRQAFVICPRIEKEDEEKIKEGASLVPKRFLPTLELKSVKEEYEKLSKKTFPDLRVDMLHGQMKPAEKESVMKKFAAGETDILVATSVIEVGVDVPNATVMMIEGADRFGLAQLYQFRGRIGRGEHKSYCFLLTDSEGASTKARLGAILSAKNGFELAEKDLALRGPGEFFGEAQTGFPDVAMEALRDADLVKATRDAAVDIVKHDQTLKHHPSLKTKLIEFKRSLHLE